MVKICGKLILPQRDLFLKKSSLNILIESKLKFAFRKVTTHIAWTQRGLNKKEIQLNLFTTETDATETRYNWNIFSIFMFNEFYLFVQWLLIA